jgi:hypothetical protein
MKKLLLPFLLIGTMVMIVIMAKTGATLKTPTTSKGILNLEFAYDTVKTNSIIKAWAPTSTSNNIRTAKNNTYWDFVFLFFYSLFLFYSCKKLAQINTSKIGLLIAKGALLAGVLDIGENMGMLVTLSNLSSNTIAMLTTILATIKWLLVIIAVLYLLWNIVKLGLNKNLKALTA